MHPTKVQHIDSWMADYKDGNRSGLYTVVKNAFLAVLFNLSQHEMTQFSVWGPRKKCAARSCDTIPSFCE